MAVILLLLSAVALLLVTADSVVIVEVDTDRCAAPLYQLTIGLSVPPSGLLNSDGNYSSTTLRMFQALSPAYIRVNVADKSEQIFNTSRTTTEGIFLTEPEWNSLNELAAKSESDLIISLDARSQFDTERLLPLLVYLEERGYSPSWQLQFDATKQISGVEAGKEIAQLRKLLDSVEGERHGHILTPDISTCGSCHYTGFIRDCLLRAGDSVDVVALQLNSENELIDEEIIFERVTKLIDAVDAKLSYNKGTQLQSTVTPPKKQLWIVESAREGYTGAFGDALLWALRLGHSANQGYSAVLHHAANMLQPTPDYWVSFLYRRLIGRGILTSSASADSVSVFTQCADKLQGEAAVVVWGVNLVPIKSQMSLRLGSRQHFVYQYILSADEREFGSTLLNGEKLELSSEGFLPKVLHLGADMTVEVPANSVFFFVLPEANARACLNNQLEYSGDLLEPTISRGKHVELKNNLEPTLDDGSSFIVVKGGLFDGVNVDKSTFEQSLKTDPSFSTREQMQRTQHEYEETRSGESSGNLQNDSERDWSKGVNDLLAIILKNKYKTEEPRRNRFSVIPRFKRSENTDQQNTHFQKRMNLFPRHRVGIDNRRVLSRRWNNQEQNSQDMALEMNKQNKNNVNTNNENDFHYRPGEFYKALREKIKLRDSNILLKDIEDPHDAIVSNTKDSSECNDKDSTLEVHMRPNTYQGVDGEVVKSTTENMSEYFKQADHVLKSSMECDHNRQGMKCCEKHQRSSDSKSARQANDGTSSYRPYNRADNIRTKRETTNVNSSELEESKINLLLKELTEEGEQLLKSVDERYLKNPLENSKEQEANINTDLPVHITDNLLTNEDEDQPLGSIKQLNNIDLFANKNTQDNGIKQERMTDKEVKTTKPLAEEIIQDSVQEITKQIAEVQDLKSSPSVSKPLMIGKTNDKQIKEVINKLAEETKFTTTKVSEEPNLLEKIIPQTNKLVKTVINSVEKGLAASKKDISEENKISDLMKDSKIIKNLLPTKDTQVKLPSVQLNPLNTVAISPTLVPKLQTPIDITLKTQDVQPLGIVQEQQLPQLGPVSKLNLNAIVNPLRISDQKENHLTHIDDLSSRITELNGELNNGVIGKKVTPLEEMLANKRKQRLDAIRMKLEEAREKMLNLKSPVIPPKLVKKRQIAISKDVLVIKPANDKVKGIVINDKKGGKNPDPLEGLKSRIKDLTSKMQQNKGATEKKEKEKEPLVPILVPLDDRASKRQERLDSIKERMAKAREKISVPTIKPQRKEVIKIIKKREVPLSQNIVNSISTTGIVKNIEYSKNNDYRDKLGSAILNKDIDAQASENHKETVSPLDDIIPSFVSPINKWIIPLSNYTENIVLNNKMFPVKLFGILSDDWVKNVRISRSSSRRQNNRRYSRAVRYPCVKDNFNDFEEQEQNDNSWKESKDVNRRFSYSQLKNTQSEINKSLSMKSKRSINDIKRNEEEMKALLTNEIIKEGPVKDTSDESQSVVFNNKLQEAVSKTVTNQTGLDKMLILAKQYQKTNPTSVEILNTRGREDRYKEPVEYNRRGVNKIKTNQEDNRAMEDLDSANNLQKLLPEKTVNRPSELLTNNIKKTIPSKYGQIDLAENSDNTTTESTNTTVIHKSEPEDIVTTILERVNGFFTAIMAVVENSVMTVNNE